MVNLGYQTILYMETHGLDKILAAVKEFGARILTAITNWSGKRFFRCCDQDGNIIEVFDAGPSEDKNPS